MKGDTLTQLRKIADKLNAPVALEEIRKAVQDAIRLIAYELEQAKVGLLP